MIRGLRKMDSREKCSNKAISASNDYKNTMTGKTLRELTEIARSVEGVAIPNRGTEDEKITKLIERLLSRAD